MDSIEFDEYKCAICDETFSDLTRHIIDKEHKSDADFIIGIYGQNKTLQKYNYKFISFPTKLVDIRSKLIKRILVFRCHFLRTNLN